MVTNIEMLKIHDILLWLTFLRTYKKNRFSLHSRADVHQTKLRTTRSNWPSNKKPVLISVHHILIDVHPFGNYDTSDRHTEYTQRKASNL